MRFRYLVAPFRYAVESRKSYFSIAPIKLSLSILSITMIVRVIELGGGGLGVSMLFLLSILSSLLAGYISPILGGLHRGYGWVKRGMVIISLLMLYIHVRGDIIITLFSAFVLQLVLNIFVYLMYVDIGGSFFRDKWSYLSRLESVGGFYWVLGLGIGLLVSYFIGYLWNYALVSIFILAYLHLGRSHIRITASSRGLENGVSRFRYRYFLLDVFLINFGLSLSYTQIFPYLSGLGASGWVVYALSFLASLTSMFTYSFVGDNFKGVESLNRGIVIRISAYLSLFIMVLLGSLITLYLSPFIFILLGFSWAYITISLNSYMLMYRERNLSRLYVAGGLGGGLGSILSGYITLYAGYVSLFVISIALLSVSMYLVRRIRILPASPAIFLRMMAVEQVRLKARAGVRYR